MPPVVQCQIQIKNARNTSLVFMHISNNRLNSLCPAIQRIRYKVTGPFIQELVREPFCPELAHRNTHLLHSICPPNRRNRRHSLYITMNQVCVKKLQPRLFEATDAGCVFAKQCVELWLNNLTVRKEEK